MTTAQTATPAARFVTIRDACKSTGVDRDKLYDAIREGRIGITEDEGRDGRPRITGVNLADVLALLGRPQPEEPAPAPAPAALPAFQPVPMREQNRPGHISPGDRQRAATMLAGVVAGDRLAVSAGVVAAQRAARVSATIAAVVDVAMEVLPELRTTDLVDRLRGIIADAGVQKLNR